MTTDWKAVYRQEGLAIPLEHYVDTRSAGRDRGTAGAMACGSCCGGLVRVVGGNYCNWSVCFWNLLSIMTVIACSADARALDSASPPESSAYVGYFESLIAPLEDERRVVPGDDFAGFAKFATVDSGHDIRRVLAQVLLDDLDRLADADSQRRIRAGQVE